MTTTSFTGLVNTNGEFETVESVTGLTLTSAKKYTIQVQNIAELKVADAVFTLENTIINYLQSSDALYIKTGSLGAVLTVLENA